MLDLYENIAELPDIFYGTIKSDYSNLHSSITECVVSIDMASFNKIENKSINSNIFLNSDKPYTSNITTLDSITLKLLIPIEKSLKIKDYYGSMITVIPEKNIFPGTKVLIIKPSKTNILTDSKIILL